MKWLRKKFKAFEAERKKLSHEEAHPLIQVIVLSKYWFHIVLIFFVANVAILRVLHLLIFSQSCMTTEQIAQDQRCLYILGNKYYEKGTKSRPHQGNPCGTNVTQLITTQPFHFEDTAFYLDPNYRGEICTGNPLPVLSPTPDPTPYIEPTPPPPIPTPIQTPNPSPFEQNSHPNPNPTPLPTLIPTSTPQASGNYGGTNVRLAPSPNPRLSPQPSSQTNLALLPIPSPIATSDTITGFGNIAKGGMVSPSSPRTFSNPSPSPEKALVRFTGTWSRVFSYAAIFSVFITGIVWVVLKIHTK